LRQDREEEDAETAIHAGDGGGGRASSGGGDRHGDGRGALNTHDLLELWEDLPEETRSLLETRFRSEVKVHRVPRDNPQAFKTEEPPTIKEICERNRHGFIDARYIAETRPRRFITDEDLKGVLMFLTDWILGKMGYAAASIAAVICSVVGNCPVSNFE